LTYSRNLAIPNVVAVKIRAVPKFTAVWNRAISVRGPGLWNVRATWLAVGIESGAEGPRNIPGQGVRTVRVIGPHPSGVQESGTSVLHGWQSGLSPARKGRGTSQVRASGLSGTQGRIRPGSRTQERPCRKASSRDCVRRGGGGG
jgi:hypothetical protein